METKGTLITAHSGCEDTPPNSRLYLQTALSLPIDAVEVDVRRAEGRLILSHDLPRGGEESLETAFCLLREREGVLINCDLKEKGLEREVLDLARACGVGGRLIYSGAVDPALFTEGSDLSCVRLYLNLEQVLPQGTKKGPEGMAPLFAQAADLAREIQLACFNVYYGDCTDDCLDLLRRRGVALSVWTPGEEADIARFLKAGVLNITTRRPRLALRLRGERG